MKEERIYGKGNWEFSEEDTFEVVKELIKDEEDSYEWVDEYSGYTCYIKRNPVFKFLLGYVEIPSSHPFFGKDLMDDCFDLEVHGGVTFSGAGRHPFKWKVGFDCDHFCDLWPVKIKGKGERYFLGGGTYKDVNFVKEECKKLAKQLKDREI